MMTTPERNASSATTPPDLQTLLRHDHERLERLFDDLVWAFRGGDRAEISTLWTAFDQNLQAHLELEEERILPAFAKVNPEETSALLRDHAAIRAALGELGVGVDLHCTNTPAVERFVALLRAHAEREDHLLYRWANAGLPSDDQRTIRTQLLAAVRKLLGAT